MSSVAVTDSEVSNLLQDEDFVSEVIERALASPEVLDDLAEEIADDLSDLIEDDPRIRDQFLTQAFEHDGFKDRVIEKLIDELKDD